MYHIRQPSKSILTCAVVAVDLCDPSNTPASVQSGARTGGFEGHKLDYTAA